MTPLYCSYPLSSAVCGFTTQKGSLNFHRLIALISVGAALVTLIIALAQILQANV